ncbi:MAG: ponA [Modestobacter sp.]|nr:ponA [Modestobacter sp.]
MSDTARFRLGALGKLVAMIVVAGVLIAALLFPWVGGTGLVARNSTSLLDALPVELTDRTPNGNTRVLAADGSLITEFYENNRTPVTPAQVSPVMKQALVDIEDSRFYEHNGLDVQGTLRALAKNVAAGGVEEGGSTLTQQLVKQTLLQTASTPEERQAATEQTVGRKLKEARLALALEQTYSKDEILTRYLNIAYFGHGAYGIQAAARTYFSVDAADLTLPQASVLAGLVQSPAADDPLAHPAAAQTRRNQVLHRMHTLGHITDQELADISASPVQTVEGAKPPNGCAQAAIGGFFCAYLKDYLNGRLKLSDAQLDNGGYTIQTTLRPDMQAAGDQGVLNTVGLDSNLIGTYDAIQPGTGHVLAMSVNRTYGCDRNTNPTCESVNFAVAPSKGSGSTFKLFVAAAALEQGKPATYTLTTSNPYVSRVYKDKGRPYTVPNVGSSYPNTLTMTQALYMSSNTYFLALEDALGSVRGPVEMAQRLGMSFNASNQKPAEKIIAENNGSFTYGTEPVSPLDLATAYATIAARGTKCEPIPLTQVLTSDGKPLTGDDGQPVVKGDQCTPNVIDPGIADTLNQMLRNDVEPGHALQTAPRAYVPGHQIAGKTGTINQNDSVAFVGSTPEYTASAFVLNPYSNASVGGFGGGKPATIWHDAMAPILTNQPTAEFPPADPKYSGGDVNRPAVSYTPPASNPGGTTTGGATPTQTPPDTATPAAPVSPAAPGLPPDTNGNAPTG